MRARPGGDPLCPGLNWTMALANCSLWARFCLLPVVSRNPRWNAATPVVSGLGEAVSRTAAEPSSCAGNLRAAKPPGVSVRPFHRKSLLNLLLNLLPDQPHFFQSLGDGDRSGPFPLPPLGSSVRFGRAVCKSRDGQLLYDELSVSKKVPVSPRLPSTHSPAAVPCPGQVSCQL